MGLTRYISTMFSHRSESKGEETSCHTQAGNLALQKLQVNLGSSIQKDLSKPNAGKGAASQPRQPPKGALPEEAWPHMMSGSRKPSQQGLHHFPSLPASARSDVKSLRSSSSRQLFKVSVRGNLPGSVTDFIFLKHCLALNSSWSGTGCIA